MDIDFAIDIDFVLALLVRYISAGPKQNCLLTPTRHACSFLHKSLDSMSTYCMACVHFGPATNTSALQAHQHHNHTSALLTMSRSFWTQVIPAKVQALDGVPGDCLFLALDALCAAAVLSGGIVCCAAENTNLQ